MIDTMGSTGRTYDLSERARQAAQRARDQTLLQGISKVGQFKKKSANRVPTNELVYRLLQHPGQLIIFLFLPILSTRSASMSSLPSLSSLHILIPRIVPLSLMYMFYYSSYNLNLICLPSFFSNWNFLIPQPYRVGCTIYSSSLTRKSYINSQFSLYYGL